MSRCRRPNKQYRSEAQAKMALSRIRADPDIPVWRKPTRAYKCEFCRRWHLTSAPPHDIEALTHFPPTPKPHPDLNDPEQAELDRILLQGIIERCAGHPHSCQTCMRDPDWAAYRIRRQLI